MPKPRTPAQIAAFDAMLARRHADQKASKAQKAGVQMHKPRPAHLADADPDDAGPEFVHTPWPAVKPEPPAPEPPKSLLAPIIEPNAELPEPEPTPEPPKPVQAPHEAPATGGGLLAGILRGLGF